MVERCVIAVRSKEEAAELLSFLEELGYMWASGELPTSNLHFTSMHGGTTYWIDHFEENEITYSSMLHPDPDYDCAADFINSHQQCEPVAIDASEVL